jgi:hypothetical protein
MVNPNAFNYVVGIYHLVMTVIWVLNACFMGIVIILLIFHFRRDGFMDNTRAIAEDKKNSENGENGGELEENGENENQWKKQEATKEKKFYFF